ncbi:hypothetical protein SAMN05660841_01559 [Sphingobacterium nematocida]|uniref:Cytochrome c domain-containing protein n=1 Tax=Sphingobacterium nematocida TaxID=1513896 RepID=A0A1T5CRW0_9SPHI|nr:cytochrome c [Sphingobacterium nematocida]SKB62164.1 hypothetical protein SAMN05660841_01559 [Sphingobacterium nematocida]
MKSTIVNSLGLLTLVILLITGCSKKQADEPKPEEPTPTTVTVDNVSYNNYVKVLFENKCNSCHASGGAGSGKWTFSGYTSVKSNAAKIANVLLVTKVMPMNGSLSAKEIELLNAWFNIRNTPEN